MLSPKKMRERIKFVLPKLSDANRAVFMRMYSPDNPTADINEVVDSIPTKKLKWALQQVENTYYKIFKIINSA